MFVCVILLRQPVPYFLCLQEPEHGGMGDVKAAVDRFQADHGSERKPVLSRLAASWVPDSDSKCCQLCQKRFSKTRRHRRHHCRCCGILTCGSCSQARVLFVPQNSAANDDASEEVIESGINEMRIPGDRAHAGEQATF